MLAKIHVVIEYVRPQKVTHIVVHVGGTHKEGANIISPLQLVCNCTIVFDLRAIVDLVIRREKWCRSDPIVRLFGPLCIGLVTSISRQSSRELEEAAI